MSMRNKKVEIGDGRRALGGAIERIKDCVPFASRYRWKSVDRRYSSMCSVRQSRPAIILESRRLTGFASSSSRYGRLFRTPTATRRDSMRMSAEGRHESSQSVKVAQPLRQSKRCSAYPAFWLRFLLTVEEECINVSLHWFGSIHISAEQEISYLENKVYRF